MTKTSDAVRAALALDKHFLHYQIEFRPDEAAEFLRATEQVNDTKPDALASLVQTITENVPPMNFGAGNPNNGNPHHTFRIGREYSRVIYLNIIKTYLPSDFDYKSLHTRLDALARQALADECDVEQDDMRRFSYRFWWD
jgi:hypothetical protein